ncbi:MAG: alpha/beta hydrolase [Chromatiales bacterium]|nr:alpha/beta hydrolase [Chromatiales bacterium]
MSDSGMTPTEVQRIRDLLNEQAKPLGMYSPEETLEGETAVGELRRRGASAGEDDLQLYSLVAEDGVLYWREGVGLPAAGGARRRGGRGWGGGEIVDQRKFFRLGRSEIASYLEDLDRKLTPNFGKLRRLKDNGRLVNVKKPAVAGRILLFVHGTFSNNDKVLQDLKAAPQNAGAKLLADATGHYDEVLTYDHPTLGVTPMLNALDLARLFQESRADVDVVTHSRGGLVTRWWLEALDPVPRQRRAVLVGSPLGGTSLAAPDKIRNGLDLMANLGNVLAAGTAMIPFMQVAAGLLRLTSSVTSLVANTPAVDAAVALVPGLAGQSRVENNAELNRLRESLRKPAPEYFVVRSDYRPEDVGWKFWKVFADWKQRAANLAADHLVFDAENDLVVDTSSMSEFGSQPFVSDDTHMLDFGTSHTVYHTNYFSQAQTVEFLRRSLGIP